MSQFVVQHVRFFKAHTHAIHCMTYDDYSKKLAVSRSDGLLEIYRYHADGVRFTFDVFFPPYINEEASSASIEALAWHNGRLFSGGMNGHVMEYDLERLGVVRTLSLDSTSIWAFAVTISPETGGGLLACGCDSGNIYFVNLLTSDCSIDSENALELNGPPVHQNDGRVLSLAWVQGSRYLVAGGIGSIEVWRFSGSRPKMTWHMALPDKVVVWSLAAYTGHRSYFVSSDSRGKITIWNAKNGTMVSELSTHSLDILCLAVGAVNESPIPTVFASGAEPTVVGISPSSLENASNVDAWLTAEIHRFHDHDVRACCFVAPNLLLTAGSDRSIIVSKINTTYYRRQAVERASFSTRIMPVSNWSSFISAERISSSQSVLAFSQPSPKGKHSVDIWQLLATPQDYEMDDENKDEKREPNRQLVIQMPVLLPPHLVKLSPLANFLAFATGSLVRVFKVDIAAPSASKHFSISFEPTSARQASPMVTAMAFIDEPSKMPLLALSADAKLKVKSCWNPEFEKTFDLSNDFKFGEDSDEQAVSVLPALFLKVAPIDDDTTTSDSFCVAIGSRDLVQLYSLQFSDSDSEITLDSLCRLPSYSNGSITALSLYSSKLVLLAFSDRRVAEFDGHSQRYTKWTRRSLISGKPTKQKSKKAKRQRLEGHNPGHEDGSGKEDGAVEKAYPPLWLDQQETIDWIGYTSNSYSKILIASSRLLATIDKTQPLPLRIDGPLFRPPSPSSRHLNNTAKDVSIRHVSRFRYILAFDCLRPFDDETLLSAREETLDDRPGEIFIAELPSGEFRNQLPPVVVTKKPFSS